MKLLPEGIKPEWTLDKEKEMAYKKLDDEKSITSSVLPEEKPKSSSSKIVGVARNTVNTLIEKYVSFTFLTFCVMWMRNFNNFLKISKVEMLGLITRVILGFFSYQNVNEFSLFKKQLDKTPMQTAACANPRDSSIINGFFPETVRTPRNFYEFLKVFSALSR